MTHNRHWFKWFKNASSVEMNVDGSGTAVSFRATSDAVAEEELEIARINFVMVDGSIKYSQFLGIAASLTNGITIKWYDSDGVEKYDFLDGEEIKSSEDFGALAGVDAVAQLVAGNDSFPVRWTLKNSGLATILNSGDYIEILIQDNLSTVVKFRAMAQGYLDP